MSRFENKLCPVCRERFRDSDDIAVCPECGTPHHRACYLKYNKCALEELHSEGFVWKGRLPDEPLDAVLPQINTPQLPVFGVPEPLERKTTNLYDESENTDKTDEEADKKDNYEDIFPNIEDLQDELKEQEEQNNKDTFEMLGLPDPDDDMFRDMGMSDPIKELYKMVNDGSRGEDGVSMQELIAYTSTSIFHYSKAFKLFRGDPNGKKRITGFNICSGLFSPIFQFYRKMDVLGIVLLIISILPGFLVVMLTDSETTAESVYYSLNGLISFINIAEAVLLCLFGDYLFYKQAVRRILKVRRSFDGDVGSIEYLKALSECGKPSYARAILGCLAMMFTNAVMFNLNGGLF